MNIFATVLTLAAVFASSVAGPQGRITYGHYANPGRFLYYVGISKYSGEDASVHCGGALISNYWVITAAHCVVNLAEVTLHLGSTNFYTPELTLTIPANFITKHPDHNASNFDNDIALINTTYIEYTHNIHKVSLPSMAGMPDVSREIFISMGWGEDEFGIYDYHHLKFVYMRGMTNAACKPHYVDGLVNEKKLCAMTHSGSPCFGDSGGPLVHIPTMTLVGITSFAGTENCDRGIPVGFIRVTEYLDWIKSVSGVYRD